MSLTLPIALLILAALAGGTLATLHFRNRHLPMPLAALHGLLAASALALLAWPIVNGVPTADNVKTALGILVLAALGGFTLLSFYLRGKRLPSALVLAHAALAATGLGCLVWAVYG